MPPPPPPPPPPPNLMGVKKSSQPDRNAMLAQIRQGAHLKQAGAMEVRNQHPLGNHNSGISHNRFSCGNSLIMPGTMVAHSPVNPVCSPVNGCCQHMTHGFMGGHCHPDVHCHMPAPAHKTIIAPPRRAQLSHSQSLKGPAPPPPLHQRPLSSCLPDLVLRPFVSPPNHKPLRPKAPPNIRPPPPPPKHSRPSSLCRHQSIASADGRGEFRKPPARDPTSPMVPARTFSVSRMAEAPPPPPPPHLHHSRSNRPAPPPPPTRQVRSATTSRNPTPEPQSYWFECKFQNRFRSQVEIPRRPPQFKGFSKTYPSKVALLERKRRHRPPPPPPLFLRI